MALINALGIKDGFGFSAGFFDYALNFGIATKPLLLIPIGLGYAAVYYFLFRFVIRKWNLRTPGREEEDEESLRAGRPDPCLTGLLLTAARIVTPARTFAPGWLPVDGRPGRRGRARVLRRGPPTSTWARSTVVPGFVDTHVHGGGGASFDGGDPAAAATVVAAHRADGHHHDGGQPGHRRPGRPGTRR